MLQLRKTQNIQSIYLLLILGNTLAASFIWGINTIFLLDAGLSNFEAFLANAFFTVGQVVFEIPTGIIADTYGRRTSYLLGCVTLTASTLLYLYMWQTKGPFVGWALSSMLLGLGFTFFSGALEAWLVDALHATKFKGSLDGVFAKGQTIGGIAMLIGSVSGGLIAQMSNLGVPYILRSVVLIINFATAFYFMKDLGFTPIRGKKPITEMKKVFIDSFDYGIKRPQIRWLMIAAPFTSGVSFYIFYALQPYLLELYGNPKAYTIAGLIAAITALAQIIGGITSPYLRRLFSKRSNALLTGIFLTTCILLLISFTTTFILAVVLIFIWGLLFAALMPIRQSLLNGAIPSERRATLLSFDSLMGSSGGIVTQPFLGRVADASGYATSYLYAAIIQAGAIPFIYLVKRQKLSSDKIEKESKK